MLLHPVLTLADDELRLCGIVQQIDKAKNTVTVDVLSSSCPGVQAFKLPGTSTGTVFNVDERKCFMIDSSRCDDSAMHTITEIEGE